MRVIANVVVQLVFPFLQSRKGDRFMLDLYLRRKARIILVPVIIAKVKEIGLLV